MFDWIGNEHWLAWGIGLLIGFPLLMILFGEMLYRIEQSQSSRRAFLFNMQYFVLPSLVIYLLLNKVIGLEHDSIILKVVASVFWISLIYLALSTFNLFWYSQSRDEKSWQSKVPNLVLNIARLFFILLGIAFVISTIWGVDLGQMLAALGVGSIVLGLALQDTLGGLFAGITLISARQFQVGDWIETNDIFGKVMALNWHSVTLKTLENDLLVIPNSVLATNTFQNYSRPERAHMERISIQFCEDHPPNMVRAALLEAARNTPGVLKNPPPRVLLKELADDAGAYEALLYFDDYSQLDHLRDAYLTRAWYAAKRHGVVFPFEDHQIYQFRGSEMYLGDDNMIEKNELVNTLVELESFELTEQELQTLTEDSRILRYGRDEPVVHIGDQCDELLVILKGQARKATADLDGRERDMGIAGPGEFIGLVSVIRHGPSQVNAIATEDLQVATIPAEALEKMLRTNPKFALELQQDIESRISTLDTLRQQGGQHGTDQARQESDKVTLRDLLKQK